MFVLPITRFNAGEASPWLEGRVDLEKYGALCRRLENWLLTPYGGVRRRPGLEYIAEVDDSSKPARLLPFQYSTEVNYVIVLNNSKMRFLKGGSSPGYVGSTLTIPWLDAELHQVQITQLNDVAYLTHPNHPPQKLTRITEASWTLADVDWKRGPMQDQNLTATTLTPSATSGAITLTSSAALFDADHVGARFSITHQRVGAEFEKVLDLTATGTSNELLVLGAWQVTTQGLAGSWTGTLRVQRYNGSTWETIREYDVQGDRNISGTGTEETLTRMRLDYTYSSHTNGPHKAVLEALEGLVTGEVEITGFTSSTQVSATVKATLFDTDATDNWREGAFSDFAGYPAAVTFHDGRLWFGGTATQPQTLFGSVSDDFENFDLGRAEDDRSITRPLTSGQRNTIRWMISERRLLVGTSGGEYVVGASGDREGQKLTPANITDRRHSNFGSAEIQAVFMNDSVLYAQRHARKIREYGYVFERDRYQAADVTLLGEHITDQGVLELAFQSQRDSILWSVTKEGWLIGMTYEKEQNIIGWHRHSSPNGAFESVTVIFGETEEDEVWTVVERVIDGNTKRYIERMEPDQYRVQEAEDSNNFFYGDAGKKVVLGGGPGTTVTGLSHLEGETVGVIGDGAQQPDKVVTGGQITAEKAATNFVVGLRFASRLEPMKLNVDLAGGTAKGREARVNRLAIEFWRSGGGYFGESADGDVQAQIDAENLWPMRWRDTADPMGSAPPLFSGFYEWDFEGEFNLEEGATVAVVNDSMYPMAVLGMVPKVQFFGDDEPEE